MEKVGKSVGRELSEAYKQGKSVKRCKLFTI